jgi:hypothetical protein
VPLQSSSSQPLMAMLYSTRLSGSATADRVPQRYG